jgi:hypothetical protein
MLGHLPSLAALESNDDGPLAAELRLARLRSQAAVVRALADHVEHLSRAADADVLGAQLVEEVARLGCRLLEAAASLPGSSRARRKRYFRTIRSRRRKADFMRVLSILGLVGWMVLDPARAAAQASPSQSPPAAAPTTAPPQQPQSPKDQPPAAPPRPQAPPTAQTIQPAGQPGQWVNTKDSGWIWVPTDTTTYAVDGVPYVYLYTPLYGWTWYASPWGWGPFVIGPWVWNPWPFGFRAWGYGVGGWGWRGGSWRGGVFHGGAWQSGAGHYPGGGARPGVGVRGGGGRGGGGRR